MFLIPSHLPTVVSHQARRLGDEAIANPTFANNGEGWTVINNDATHIITFSEAGARYQSDTVAPILFLSQAAGLTPYKRYQMEVDIGSVAGAGGLKIWFGNDIFQIPAQVGKHRTILRIGTNLSVTLTRDAANVDLIISKVSFRPIL